MLLFVTMFLVLPALIVTDPCTPVHDNGNNKFKCMKNNVELGYLLYKDLQPHFYNQPQNTPNKEIKIDEIEVLPSHQHIGVGRLLMERFLTFAEDQLHKSEVSLYVKISNQNAIDFYKMWLPTDR
uniref:N-acetyltransferase domain-containing protein n=1 Tax=Ditylenchus dipsaci TaxID=166011 RepID=A0A915D8N9_9BILA